MSFCRPIFFVREVVMQRALIALLMVLLTGVARGQQGGFEHLLAPGKPLPALRVPYDRLEFVGTKYATNRRGEVVCAANFKQAQAREGFVAILIFSPNGQTGVICPDIRQLVPAQGPGGPSVREIVL